jgi:hypothetical protein
MFAGVGVIGAVAAGFMLETQPAAGGHRVVTAVADFTKM